MLREIPRYFLRLLPSYLRNKLMQNIKFRSVYSLSLAKNKNLCAELLEMSQKDQGIRNESSFIFENWKNTTTYPEIRKLIIKCFDVDETNTAKMKEIIANYGFPAKSLVGLMGTQAAWLLVQHADHDPGFQEQCLILMEEALKQDEVVASNVAYLTDRVRVSQVLPQVYGTQWSFNNKPQPIQDKDRVNERRASVGLEPIEIYAASIGTAGLWQQETNLLEYRKCMEEIAAELPTKYKRKVQEELKLIQPEDTK